MRAIAVTDEAAGAERMQLTELSTPAPAINDVLELDRLSSRTVRLAPSSPSSLAKQTLTSSAQGIRPIVGRPSTTGPTSSSTSVQTPSKTLVRSTSSSARFPVIWPRPRLTRPHSPPTNSFSEARTSRWNPHEGRRARPSALHSGTAIDFVVESSRCQLAEIAQEVLDGRLRTNISDVAVLDDAVTALNPTERLTGTRSSTSVPNGSQQAPCRAKGPCGYMPVFGRRRAVVRGR